MFKKPVLAVSVAIVLVVSACGGGAGGGGAGPGNTGGGANNIIITGAVITGTAATGVGISGSVVLKDSLGSSKTVVIGKQGRYKLDVSTMQAPFLLRAEGVAGGRRVTEYSYASQADIGGTVNITPLTDLILANAVGETARAYFASGDITAINRQQISTQERRLQSSLQGVLNALAIPADVDLLHSDFVADRTGLDAVLDSLRVTVDEASGVATIVNVVDNTRLTDDLKDPADNEGAVLGVNSDLEALVPERQAIEQRLQDYIALFRVGLPSKAQVAPFIASSFLDRDIGRADFLNALTHDEAFVGMTSSPLDIERIDRLTGSAEVHFLLTRYGRLDPNPVLMHMVQEQGVWKLAGDQHIADISTGFFCEQQITGNAPVSKDCGALFTITDKNPDNNVGVNLLVQSARISLLRQGAEVPGSVVLLGTPAGGMLQVFDQGRFNGSDALSFKRFDPRVFQLEDVYQIELFTSPLDTSKPNSPQTVGTAIVTYADSHVEFLPQVNAQDQLYPVVDQVTLDRLAGFVGGSVQINGSAPAGQTINELYLALDDGNGQRVAVRDIGDLRDVGRSTGHAVTLDVAALSTNPASDTHELRIYSNDLIGQNYLTTYLGSMVIY